MSKHRLFIALLITAVLISLCALPSVSAQEDEEVSPPWSMSNGDARHSGVSPFIMEEMPEDVIWEMELEDAPTQDMALGPEGNIYLVHDDQIDAYDHDGQPLWAYEAELEIVTELAIDQEGKIYFFLSEEELPTYLVAITAEGELINEVPLAVPEISGTFTIVDVSAPVILLSGGVCFTTVVSGNDEMTQFDCMINVATVDETSYSIGSSSPAVSMAFESLEAREPAVTSNGSILFPAGNGVFAVDKDLGQVWSYLLPGFDLFEEATISDIFLDEDDGCYFMSEGTLFSIDDEGGFEWALDDLEIAGMNIASVSSMGLLFEDSTATQGADRLVKISTSGLYLWSYDIDTETYPGDCTITTSDGLTMICGNDAIIGIGTDGLELWRSDVAAPDDEETIRTFYDPVMGANGTLYMISIEDGEYSFYAVGNWLEEAVYNFVFLFSLMFAPFFIIAGCYFYFREDKK